MIRLSDIEKAIVKKIIIIDGKPEWVNQSINGDIVFNELTPDIIKKINDEVIQKLTNETQEQVAYLMLPYLVDVECDISLENFMKLMNSKNTIVLMLFEGIMNCIEEVIKFSELSKRTENINLNLPEIVESDEDKIVRLTQEMNEESDPIKKKALFKELSQLYAKLGD